MATQKWIDKHQAKVFIGMSLLVLIVFVIVIVFWGNRPIDLDKIEALGFSLGLGVSGIASSAVILSLLWAHDDKSYWGEGKDAYPFIVIGAVITLIAAAIQLFKAFVAVLPS